MTEIQQVAAEHFLVQQPKETDKKKRLSGLTHHNMRLCFFSSLFPPAHVNSLLPSPEAHAKKWFTLLEQIILY